MQIADDGSRARGSAVLDRLRVPVIQAPMAGGPNGTELAAAVIGAGGLGFLAAGYLAADQVGEQIEQLRAATAGDFGVNLFVGGERAAAPADVEAYARRLAPLAERAGVALGQPRFDGDGFDDKLALLIDARVPVVSFTFGLPPQSAVDALHGAGSEVWMTVTSPPEATLADARGADALVVQGREAGGHRGIFSDEDGASDLTLVAALQLVRVATDLPLVAAGALMTGGALAAVLALGARAGQIGTALLRADEAQTPPVHRDAVAGETRTVLTRAFSGRLARGIHNRWHEQHGAQAPAAYPEVHHLTSPLRAHGRAVGDAGLINLWAGEGHALARAAPAADIVEQLAEDAARALAEAARRLAARRETDERRN
jgi:nitronate monooxygenase